MKTSISLPIELLRYICDFIDHPADLLATGLACKTLRDIIIPNHLHYREIRCDLQLVGFWKALTQNKRLISQVRFLEVVSMNSDSDDWDSDQSRPWWKDTQILPPLPEYDREADSDDEENGEGLERMEFAVHAVGEAILCMPRLKRFHWHIAASPSSQIFDSLYKNCPDLEEVEVLDWDTGATNTNSMSCKLYSLSNLTRFSYSVLYKYWDSTDSYKRRANQLAAMLARFPNLEDLQLLFKTRPSGRILVTEDDPLALMFATTFWPHLRRLNIEGIYLAYQSSFFSNHPTLEALCITKGAELDLVLNHLPSRLRSLAVDWFLEAAQINPSFAPNLSHLDMQLSEVYEVTDSSAQASILPLAINLRSLVLRSDHDRNSIKNVIKYIPEGLQRLAIVLDWRVRDSPWEVARKNSCPMDKEASTDILKRLPNLTHLSPIYVEVWTPRDQPDEFGFTSLAEDKLDHVQETLDAIIELAPALRFFGIKYDDANTYVDPPEWFMLERNHDGGFDGFTEVMGLRYQKDIDVRLWGDLYRGSSNELIDV